VLPLAVTKDDSRDRAVTTVTDDGCFRVITARTTQTVASAIEAQKARGRTAEHLADLLTGSALVRLTMAPSLRVQGLVRGSDGKGTIVADCHPDGGCRALVRETAGPIQVGPGSMMQLMRSLPNGSLHQGVVEVPHDYGISGALMVYMLESEQVTSVIGVGCAIDDGGRVAVAGGWIIQLLPECTEPPLDRMYARMRAEFADVKSVLRGVRGDPDALQREILEGIPYTETACAELEHRCYCSPERVFASLASLGRADLTDIIRKGETLFVSCDYCGRPYEVLPESLRGLLDAS
jgi:molecular chaperone Hsp33